MGVAWRLPAWLARRGRERGGSMEAAGGTKPAMVRLAPAAGGERPGAARERRVPYGERLARNRQLTLLAELLGEDWRRELPERFGVEAGELTRRQAAAAIRRLTGGARPAHVARGTWHRVAVDPDWIDRPRGRGRRRAGRTGTTMVAASPEPGTGGVLPIQVKALRLLGERLGVDVAAAAAAQYGRELGGLDRGTAAAWIAELTHQVLLMRRSAAAAG